MRHFKEMKRALCCFATAMLAMGVTTSCQSNESKAEQLVLDRVIDWKTTESYESVNTRVKEAKQTPYNDSLIVDYAKRLLDLCELGATACETPPQLESGQQDIVDFFTAVAMSKMGVNLCVDSINARVAQLDTNKVIGYEILQFGQKKLKNGGSEETHFRVITDMNFSKAMIIEDTTSPQYAKYRNVIKLAIEHRLEKMPDRY